MTALSTPMRNPMNKDKENLLDFFEKALGDTVERKEDRFIIKATMCDAGGNAMEIKCKCGNEASSVIMSKESYIGLCNKCQYGEQ